MSLPHIPVQSDVSTVLCTYCPGAASHIAAMGGSLFPLRGEHEGRADCEWTRELTSGTYHMYQMIMAAS